MAAKDYSQFHELAEQFKGEIPLKKICEQEGVSYHSYLVWRSRMGIAPRRKPSASGEVLVEMTVEGEITAGPSPKTTAVHIEFENGLTFDRSGMDVDALVEFLTKIRGALCLG